MTFDGLMSDGFEPFIAPIRVSSHATPHSTDRLIRIFIRARNNDVKKSITIKTIKRRYHILYHPT